LSDIAPGVTLRESWASRADVGLHSDGRRSTVEAQLLQAGLAQHGSFAASSFDLSRGVWAGFRARWAML